MAEKTQLQYSGDIRLMHERVGFGMNHEILREIIRSLCRGIDVFAATMGKVESMVREMPDYESKVGISGYVFRILPSCNPNDTFGYRLYVRSNRERIPTMRFIPISFSPLDGKINTVGPAEELTMGEMDLHAAVNDFNRRRSAALMDRVVAAAEKQSERSPNTK
jgi:hypothetical protein